MTPLASISKIICKDLSLIKNQTILYQLAIKFTCSKLYNDYGCTETDQLVEQIKSYLQCCYRDEDTSEFCELHRIIYSNLIEESCEFRDISKMDKTKLLGTSELVMIKSNINKIIQGKRKLPKYWIKEYEKSQGNIEPMVERLFWFLQYVWVFYGENVRKNTALDLEKNFKHCNYYILGEEKYKETNHKMKQYLSREFPYIWEEYDFVIDLKVMAIIIVETCIKQLDEYMQENNDTEKYALDIIQLIKRESFTYVLLFRQECKRANDLLEKYCSEDSNISFYQVIELYQHALEIVL